MIYPAGKIYKLHIIYTDLHSFYLLRAEQSRYVLIYYIRMYWLYVEMVNVIEQIIRKKPAIADLPRQKMHHGVKIMQDFCRVHTCTSVGPYLLWTGVWTWPWMPEQCWLTCQIEASPLMLTGLINVHTTREINVSELTTTKKHKTYFYELI